MARTTQPLTNTEVKQAKPKGKEYNLADGGGLMLRVKPSGSKAWIFNYSRPYTKKRANISFGVYPDVSLKQAREKREAARKLLAKDVDPKESRDKHQAAQKEAALNTLEEICTRWFEVKSAKLSDRYAFNIWRSFENYIFPYIGKVPIHKVTAVQVIDVIQPVAAKGSLETVKRLCQRLNEVMVFAVNTGIITSNSLSGISKAFESPQETNLPTLKPEELPELMATLETAKIKITTRHLIEFQLHTMVRPSEAAGARWSEIDEVNKLWNIPAERMKKKRDHSVPLSPQTMAILNQMKPISHHREHIFPADHRPRDHANPETANMALKRMGFKGRLVAHGLRALASTALNEHGFDPDVIEAALAHVDKNQVRAAYNRAEYLERRRVMMNWWSECVVSDRSPFQHDKSKVIAMR